MRITCPNCAAEYDVGQVIAPGRVVRCARCATDWTPVSPPPVGEERVVVEEPVAAPQAPPPRREFLAPPHAGPQAAEPPRPLIARPAPPPPPEPPGRAALALAWVSSAVLLVMILAALYVFRAPIMHAWPPSTRAYAALGLA